jgi:hypothetical protein
MTIRCSTRIRASRAAACLGLAFGVLEGGPAFASLGPELLPPNRSLPVVAQAVMLQAPLVQPRYQRPRYARAGRPAQTQRGGSRRSNPAAGRGRAPGNGVGNRGQGKKLPDAPVSLSAEVQSLQERHPSLLSNLTPPMRRLDGSALPVVEKLPLLAQFGYLTTAEDYKTLSVDEQGRLQKLMQGLSGLSAADLPRYTEAVTRRLGSVERNAETLKTARGKPHEVCFQLQEELNRLGQPGK